MISHSKKFIFIHIPTQSSMFTGANGEPLVDAIFRSESLNRGFKALKTRFGFKSWRQRLPHLKKSKRNVDYKSYYDD